MILPVRTALLLSAICTAATPVAADDVDVFLVLGQSNAGNFAETASTGAVDVGFNLDFARVQDRPHYFVPPSETSGPPFSTNLLDTSNAVSILAQDLNSQTGNDIAVFSYIRNGAPVIPSTNQQFNDGTLFYWGTDPAVNPQPDNNSLYGAHLLWVDERLNEITTRGDTPVVKGVFWYQGESSATNSVNALDYQAATAGFLDRLRTDYGADLPVIGTKIRNGNVANLYSLSQSDAVNNGMTAAAANDDFFAVTDPNGFAYRSGTDVHLSDPGLASLAPVWSAAYQNILNPPPTPTGTIVTGPEPSTNVIAESAVNGGIGSRIFDEAANANHARGQLFTLGDAGGDNIGFDIDSISIQSNEATTFGAGSTLTLFLFTGNSADIAADFAAGSGHTTAANGSDYFVGTNVTVQYTEVFDLDGLSVSSGDWYDILLTDDVTLAEETDHGFLLVYEQAGSPNNSLFYRESQPDNGGRIAVTTMDHSGGSSRMMNFNITGTAVAGLDPADLDGDGDVDDADFGIAFAAFTGPNNGPSSNPAADLDGDGDVDDADFGIAFAAFTGPGGSANVPEPTSLALLALGGLLAARRRRA